MELLYRISKADRVLGSVEREKAHTEGILHRSGVVFLSRSDGKILVQKRSKKRKTFPDYFECSASFHVTFGESYKQAALRELKEETGIYSAVRYIGKFSHFDYPENEFVAVYLANSDEPVRIDKSEASGAGFYTKGQVDKMAASRKVAPWFRDAWKIAKQFIEASIDSVSEDAEER